MQRRPEGTSPCGRLRYLPTIEEFLGGRRRESTEGGPPHPSQNLQTAGTLAVHIGQGPAAEEGRVLCFALGTLDTMAALGAVGIPKSGRNPVFTPNSGAWSLPAVGAFRGD